MEFDWSRLASTTPPARVIVPKAYRRLSPKVKRWLEKRNLLFAHVRDDVNALISLNAQHAGKLMDDVPEVLKLFDVFRWGRYMDRDLFAEFVKRGCRFREQVHVMYLEHYGPIVIDALGQVPNVYPTTPFIAEILEKFGPWHERFDHPFIEKVRNEKRLAVLRRVIVDGDGAISARVGSFLG